MAPAKLVQDEDEESHEKDEFIRTLRASHAERGTSLDLAPRVNGKQIDLFKLFKVIKGKGGYDVVSAEKLAWRKAGTEFNLGQSNQAAYAFALKTVYYKNLAAYEIRHVHGQEPPPREILEDISAKGGDILKRTVENFRPPQPKEQLNGQESDDSGDEGRGTPKQDKMELDEPGSGGGRTTRGLRQAPPQRVIFQPDTASSRQPRTTSSQYQSPQPFSSAAATHAYNPASNPNSASFNIETYQPREQLPLTLKVVQTPSFNPGLFQEKVRRMRESMAARLGQKTSTAVTHKGMMLPGTGFDGPNIYVRTLLALRSGLPSEQAYALHHLVKISHERGDKYKFEAFPGLAEGLIEKVLEVSSLYYDIKWEISYADDGSSNSNILDGINGTPDILQRVRALKPLEIFDELEPEEFSRTLSKINEAGLVIRNMILLEDNSKYLAESPPLRDYLVIALNLPRHPSLIELRQYALDVCEQLTKYWSLQGNDPLYQSLLQELESEDRGAILTVLRAISRISMNLEESNRLEAVPLRILERIFRWLLLEDEELVGACLDFLYQYTAIPGNVALLLSAAQAGWLSLPASMAQFARLLQHNAEEKSTTIVIHPAVLKPRVTEVPDVPQDLLEVICKKQEPARSSDWLKTCFEEDPNADITQIELWQAYQKRFSEYSNPENPLLAAADFIKNVSTTLPAATAQVVGNAPSQKFIIRGIRPRYIPVNSQGRPYSECEWKHPGSKQCKKYFMEPKDMWNHIVSIHLRIPHKEDGTFDIDALRPSNILNPSMYECHWANCRRFSVEGGTNNPYSVAQHLKVHLPDPTRVTAEYKARQKKIRFLTLEEVKQLKYQDTMYDEEKHDAAGLPLTAALILRNLARNIPKAASGLDGTRGESDGLSGEAWMERLFEPLRPALFHVLVHNRALFNRVGDIIWMIDASRREL